MRKIYFILLLSICSLDLFSQTGNLEIFVPFYINDHGRSRSKLLGHVLFNGDTISKQTFKTGDDTLSLNGLRPGSYSFTLHDSLNKDKRVIHDFIVKNDSLTRITINYSASTNISRIDTSGAMYGDKTDIKIGLTYSDNSWFDASTPIRSHVGINMFGGPTHAFSKHFALFFGYIFAFSHSYFSKDSSLLTLTERKYERYSYLSMGYYAGIRIASHDLKKEGSKGLYLDVGGFYNFPLSFRHTAAYYGNEKRVHAQIHKFSDLRAFVHFGWMPVQLTFEYIITDFLEGNYPELPKYIFGISFSNSLY